jgi:uncharacterized membrane protein
LTDPQLGSGENKLETAISYLLITGVAISVMLETIGMALYFGSFGNLQISRIPAVFVTGENFFAFTLSKIESLFVSENSYLFMTLGIIVLLLTPYLRAIASFGFFVWEKNRKYALITLFVLLVLTVSLAVH